MTRPSGLFCSSMQKRIYGLETEYALLYYPLNPGSPTPSQKHIYELFSDVLQQHYACAPAWYRKQGQFLANSLLLHYEARGDSYYQGLIEGCTPECLSPRELLIYQRSLDEILRDLVSKTEERLATKGFVGRLVIGKNSTDTHGNTYGCHENYLVDDPVYPPLWILYPLSLLVVLAIGVPILWMLCTVILLVLALFVASLIGTYLSAILSNLPFVGWPFLLLERVFRTPLRVVERVPEQEWFKILNSVTQLSFLPPAALLSAILSRTTFRPIRKSLTPFLITRPLFTGSGYLALEEEAPGLHLSQRALAIRSVAKIFWDDLNKPIYDLKNFIFEIGSPLRRHKRLHILFSDSNMSEVSQYLKVGTTGLVLKMIESGYDFGALEVRRPVQALRRVSRLGHGALLDLRRGGQKSALQVQREYLAAARRFVSSSPEAEEEDRRIVDLWEETLHGLDENPMALCGRIDWVIKKRMMDAAILERTTWHRFSQWGRIIEKLRSLTGEGQDFGDSSFDGLKAAVGEEEFETLRRMAESAGLETEEFQFFYDLYYQVKKLDLRYHEISGEGGYYGWLEQTQMVERITTEDELEEARKKPPRFTRAHIRGHYVSLSADRKYDVLVGWGKIRNRTLKRTIFLDDPFQHELEP
ncbi:MAG: proteasome accessory factor PafA2 family protein [Planctomycetes bacterium]|nr:proteasome accessory factor PafA2 family protein [Planctomycetota bacterium]